MAGTSAERQETAFVKAINDSIKKNKNNPVSVKTGRVVINGVMHAGKFAGRQSSGSEPYTDVQLTLANKKKVNLSLKGEAAPSLAGGGLRGIETVLPGIGTRFFKAAYAHLTQRLKLKIGSKVPDVYGELASASKKKLVIGTEAIGGPIDYMYIGSMNVTSRYDSKTNVLEFSNGNLIKADVYASTHRLFFRLRARRIDQRFDPNAMDSRGVPKIYGVSPSKGDSAGRLVVTDSVPAGAVIIQVS